MIDRLYEYVTTAVLWQHDAVNLRNVKLSFGIIVRSKHVVLKKNWTDLLICAMTKFNMADDAVVMKPKLRKEINYQWFINFIESIKKFLSNLRQVLWGVSAVCNVIEILYDIKTNWINPQTDSFRLKKWRIMNVY